jgi:hypothetical protein
MWFKYDRDDLCVNKSHFVPVIFEPPCIYRSSYKCNVVVMSSMMLRYSWLKFIDILLCTVYVVTRLQTFKINIFDPEGSSFCGTS